MCTIVIFIGSFNPPTLAHERLLGAAMNAISADQGLFVPLNNSLVTKKMNKTDWPDEVLSEETRVQMLAAICAADDRFAVGKPAWTNNPRDVVDRIQEMTNPSTNPSDFYFIFTGDTVKEVTIWEGFNEGYNLIVFRREGFDPTQNSALSEVSEKITILPSPEGIEDISSTAVRDDIRSGNDRKALSMLRQEVYDLLQGTPIHRETSISSLRGKYRFLNNLYLAEVTYDGLTFPTSEAAFQAAKCQTKEERLPFTEMKNSVLLLQKGRKVTLRPDWEEVKVGIMEEIVREKFSSHPDLAEKLLATGDLPIMEGNVWHDTFWGVDVKTGIGENHLGKILMKVREELKAPVVTPQEPENEKKEAPKQERIVLTVGMTLLHPTFGEGTVTAITEKRLSRIVDVEFVSVGLKHLGIDWVEKNCSQKEHPAN